jgi:hypothetical protein
MYLGLRRPWERHVATVASDNPPVVVVPGDAGIAKPHGKKRHRPTGAAHPAGGSAAFDGDAEETDPGPSTVALTAADRALDTRGDETTLPAQTIDMAGGGHDARPLDDGEIGSVINSQGGGIKDCVVQGATNTDLRGSITLKLVVDGHGKVIKSRVQAPHYLLEHGLLGCTQRALARMHFPATGAPTLVTFPINLG